MSLKHIRLELARDHDFPTGSRERGYDVYAPLDHEWPGQKDEIGRLVHKRGGNWAFDYNPATESDDETGFKFDKHRFVPGDYVSITEHDHVQRTFFIKAVVDLD
jgi:hypothetical protein